MLGVLCTDLRFYCFCNDCCDLPHLQTFWILDLTESRSNKITKNKPTNKQLDKQTWMAHRGCLIFPGSVFNTSDKSAS